MSAHHNNTIGSSGQQPNNALLSSMQTFNTENVFRAHVNTNIPANNDEDMDTIFNNLTYQEPHNENSVALSHLPSSPPMRNSAEHLVAVLDSALDIMSDMSWNEDDDDINNTFGHLERQ